MPLPTLILDIFRSHFVNAQANYYSAPQQLDAKQVIIGHSHFVIEKLESMSQTTPLDNTKFAFFQGVNTPVDGNSNLNVQVTEGLPAGVYRMASINAAANHQPVLVAIAQHGSLDDMVYFTVSANGAAASNATATTAAAAASGTAAAGGAKGNANNGNGNANAKGKNGRGRFAREH